MSQIVVVLAALALPSTAAAGSHATTDRADELDGRQVHLVYVVPASGSDRSLDLLTIPRSFAVAQGWLRGQTDGRALRLDTSGAVADVTFFQAADDDASPEAIDRALTAAGIATDGSKRYVAYYDGPGPGCGASVRGKLAVLYLACNPASFSSGTQGAGFWEYMALRQTLHMLGGVPPCAPNDVAGGFVSDSPEDLMYLGPDPWAPAVLDFNGDDYFDHRVAGCADLSRSPFIESRAPAITVVDVRTGRHKGVIRVALTAICPERCRVTIDLIRNGRRIGRRTRTVRPGSKRFAAHARGGPGRVLVRITARHQGGRVTRLDLDRTIRG
jgi:hypothetical protein